MLTKNGILPHLACSAFVTFRVPIAFAVKHVAEPTGTEAAAARPAEPVEMELTGKRPAEPTDVESGKSCQVYFSLFVWCEGVCWCGGEDVVMLCDVDLKLHRNHRRRVQRSALR